MSAELAVIKVSVLIRNAFPFLGGSMAERLKVVDVFGEEAICQFAYQLVSGVHYLHGCGIAHRDLKGKGSSTIQNRLTAFELFFLVL